MQLQLLQQKDGGEQSPDSHQYKSIKNEPNSPKILLRGQREGERRRQRGQNGGERRTSQRQKVKSGCATKIYEHTNVNLSSDDNDVMWHPGRCTCNSNEETQRQQRKHQSMSSVCTEMLVHQPTATVVLNSP